MRRSLLRNPFRLFHQTVRRFLLCTLMLAVPIYGSTGSLFQILGPVHRHVVFQPPAQVQLARAAPTAIAGQLGLAWIAKRWQAWKGLAHRQSHSGLLTHAHHHESFERHHHMVGDDRVIALGVDEAATAAAAEPAAAGSATLPMGMSMSWLMPPSMLSIRCWSSAAQARWRNADARRRERPPQI